MRRRECCNGSICLRAPFSTSSRCSARLSFVIYGTTAFSTGSSSRFLRRRRDSGPGARTLTFFSFLFIFNFLPILVLSSLARDASWFLYPDRAGCAATPVAVWLDDAHHAP